MTTLMWEAVASDVDAVLTWARGYDADGLSAIEAYVSTDSRVVLVTHWRDAAAAVAADLTAPAGTLEREPHTWTFEQVL
jgi:hypothetical protein